ncbi:MAG TPA: hypothetical protein VKT78_09490 [Fimbriimonadaceae bacterium]|nr:hypothetical protein [Fimbriimonadaceae bacterium]
MGFAIVAAVGYFGWTYGAGAYILSQHFGALEPRQFCLVGLKTGHGFTIQVSNRVAHLVESKDVDFQNSGNDKEEETESEGASKKKLPIKEMMDSLRGDEAALSKFVGAVGDLNPKEEWPPRAPVWSAEDIKKVLAGDPELTKKLVPELNVDLDGKPLSELHISALENGIIVETPVPVHVQVGAQQRLLQARVKRWYQPDVMVATNARFSQRFDVTNKEKAAYYKEAVDDQQAKGKLENVRQKLERLVDPSGLMDAAAKAELILSSAFVVVTDEQIDHASFRPSEVGTQGLGKDTAASMWDLDLHVTNEGRLRLWQYSKLHPHDQLLLVSNGVAIAAPRIRHELVDSNLTIVQMPDKGLLVEAVDSLQKNK